jgi:hypothetical protein
LNFEYNVGEHFHVGAEVGVDVIAGQFTAERADGSRIFATRTVSAHGALGLGLHF